jgi:diguanylate cyclase (GGDEF)-like protein
MKRLVGRALVALAAIILILLPGEAATDGRAPALLAAGKLVVVTDDNYPPYLFRSATGELQGILRDKWLLWGQVNGVTVELQGTSWSRAQEMVRSGEADVIDALSQTPARAALYEFSTTPAAMEARVFFHKSVTGVNDAESLRGFVVGAKEGSACGEWLRERGVHSIRGYPESEAVVKAAAQREVRMFCMDSLAGQYFLVKNQLADEYRQSPALYVTPFDWAVRSGRTELRDFIQAGFARVGPRELANVEARWRGEVVRYPSDPRQLYWLLAVGLGVLAVTSLVLFRNRALRRLVGGHAAELIDARESLQKQAARTLYLATRDPLTDLPNRHDLLQRLGERLERARRKDKLVGVISIDLDRFKAVNDTFGQEAGDRLLQVVAERLRKKARAKDLVARMGGDEYVVVLPGLDTTMEAASIARELLASIDDPCELGGQKVFCTASAGIAIFPYDGITPLELLRNADMAMDCAKDHGRNNVQYYRHEMRHAAVRRLELETGLRAAVERQEFEVYYQPRVGVKSGRVSGFEALLRWRHPRHGLLSPAEFIPILEDTGLIVPVGEWVIRTACEQIKRWTDDGATALPIAVNLSARQFHQRDLDKVVARLIAETGIEPVNLELELTESLLMREPEEAARTMHRLASQGVRIAIDDFGTGYSSLAYLRRFPIASLKIDRAFIHGVNIAAEDATITRTIIHLAHNLGLKVIAEGVETEDQRTFLEAGGCDEMQGFLFSEAVPADQTAALLAIARAQSDVRRAG